MDTETLMREDMGKEAKCRGNTNKQEVIYSNDGYRVEKIGIKTPDEVVYIYGVYSNTYGVLEVETPILAKALNTADELDQAVTTFFQSKAFEPKSDSVIESA